MKLYQTKIKYILYILILCSVVTIAVIFYNSGSIVKAYSNNYNKAAPGDISAVEWDALDNDFVDKQSPGGSSMAGPLALPGDPTSNMHAATKQYVDNNIFGGSTVTDKDNNVLKVVCDSTSIGSTDWHNKRTPSGSLEGVYTDINTRSIIGSQNFTATPNYFVSIGGNNYMYEHSGAGIFNPTTGSFRLVVRSIFADTQAEAWGWYVNWCGVGQ